MQPATLFLAILALCWCGAPINSGHGSNAVNPGGIFYLPDPNVYANAEDEYFGNHPGTDPCAGKKRSHDADAGGVDAKRDRHE